MTLVVDLRRAFDSGLGTYIREVVPKVLQRLPGVPVLGVIARGDEDRHRTYLGDALNAWLPCNAGSLSVAEQWSLRRLLPPNAVFWATSLAHPLFTSHRLVATVHDVLQLALPAPSGASGLARLACRLYFESLRQRAQVLLFNSNFTQTQYTRWVGSGRGNGVVTPLGVDTRRWQPDPAVAASSVAEASKVTPYFMCVGNFRAHKNLPVLLDAYARLSDTLPHELWLVGRAHGFRTEESALLARVRSMAPRVRYLGEVNDLRLRECVAAATALIMPSMSEGFGLPVLEAMASGCPVIASSAGALPEAGADVALYFDPADSLTLGQRLFRVANLTADERGQLVGRGLAHAKLHSWERTADTTAGALSALFQPLAAK